MSNGFETRGRISIEMLTPENIHQLYVPWRLYHPDKCYIDFSSIKGVDKVSVIENILKLEIDHYVVTGNPFVNTDRSSLFHQHIHRLSRLRKELLLHLYKQATKESHWRYTNDYHKKSKFWSVVSMGLAIFAMVAAVSNLALIIIGAR